MQVQNQKLRTCPFDEYLALPGYSYSGLKQGDKVVVPTKKMHFGTLVHNYLLTPEEYTHEQAELVVPLAKALKQKLGSLFQFLQPEMAVTANFIYQGFNMPYKGRIDLGIPGKIVVDIKVSEMPLHKAIEFFGYDKQLSGYCYGIGARAAIIVGINPKNKLIAVYNVPISADWWEYQIIQKGDPII